MDIISRIKRYMEHRHLTSSQFADAAGIPRPTLSQLLNGRNKSNEGAKKISSDIVKKLHDAFPALNVMWLLFGDGDMETVENIRFSEPQNAPETCNNSSEHSDNQDIQRQISFDEGLPDFDTENNFASNQSFSQPHNNKNAYNLTDDQRVRLANRQSQEPTMSLQPDKTKKVQSIMVFYSDNSFEIFRPSE